MLQSFPWGYGTTGAPWKINGWNLQITHLERKMIFQTSMIMFHVNLPGCTDPPQSCWRTWIQKKGKTTHNMPGPPARTMPSQREISNHREVHPPRYPQQLRSWKCAYHVYVLHIYPNSRKQTAGFWNAWLEVHQDFPWNNYQDLWCVHVSFRGFVFFAENLADQTKVDGLCENQWVFKDSGFWILPRGRVWSTWGLLGSTRLCVLPCNKQYRERFCVSSKLYGALPNNRMHTIRFAWSHSTWF